ncbi:MAG: efflux RND transporter periplasmic adaptor subunit [Verrucomicrobiales bacterium]|nr:efflux RND transporter periplasmic adaptor subunit [Verrucomicrobiales bacterium]
MKASSLSNLLSNPSSSRLPRRGRFKLVTLFPWILILGFVGLSLLLFGEQLLPARAVEIEKVVTVRATSSTLLTAAAEGPESNPWAGVTLFQASGWVEPDPLPIKATALVNGVVETVSVLEGETVTRGQALATLIREDFELDLETAAAELVSLEGLYEAHEAEIEAVLAQVETLELRIKAGEMRCLELIDRRDRLTNAGSEAVAEGERVSAELMLQTHESEVAALAASKEELRSELKRLEALRVDFEARIARAGTEVARKELALERTEIRSPVDGIVLRLLVSPGQKRMLDMDDVDSATIAVIYRPDFLQARIDVPLEEASQLGVGQAVRLRSNFLPDKTFQGTVTRIVGEADLQRNTLQVKVKLLEPDPRLRPDMLCRAEFLATASEPLATEETAATTGYNRVSVYVPASALFERDEKNAALWTLDSSGKKAEKRQVVLGQDERDDHLHVTEGILPGEFVLINPPSDLAAGERLKTSTHSGNE